MKIPHQLLFQQLAVIVLLENTVPSLPGYCCSCCDISGAQGYHSGIFSLIFNYLVSLPFYRPFQTLAIQKNQPFQKQTSSVRCSWHHKVLAQHGCSGVATVLCAVSFSLLLMFSNAAFVPGQVLSLFWCNRLIFMWFLKYMLELFQ